MSTSEEKGSSQADQVASVDTTGLDAAWEFLNHHREANGVVDMAALRRKIDWHILPLMFCCYTMQFLDKVILNVRLQVYLWDSGWTRFDVE